MYFGLWSGFLIGNSNLHLSIRGNLIRLREKHLKLKRCILVHVSAPKTLLKELKMELCLVRLLGNGVDTPGTGRLF
jgi:hypothetical protein